MAVIMYVYQKWLSLLWAAKEYFENQGVSFTEINFSNNPEKIDELVKLAGVRKAPVIMDDGKVTVGFDGGA